MSLATWVKGSQGASYRTLFHGYATAGHAGYGVQTWPGSGQPKYHPGWSDAAYYAVKDPGLPNLMDEKWHHVAVTADGTAVRFYVDGKTRPDWKRTQADVSQGSYTGDRFIGRHANTASDSEIVGYLDDMGIWKNRALSPADVALLHGLGRVQGSDLSWVDEAAALWARGVGERSSIDGVVWEKVTGLEGSPGDCGGSTGNRDGYIVLDTAGGGIRMASEKAP
jgi:hypothetical protein